MIAFARVYPTGAEWCSPATLVSWYIFLANKKFSGARKHHSTSAEIITWLDFHHYTQAVGNRRK